jgi:hypothetical protein
MPPHLTAMLDALGLPNVIPEPEVTRKAVASVQCRSLAAVIAEISEAGMFFDVPCEDYFADPCPRPSLSNSGIGVLLNQSPAHFAARHPRLNGGVDAAARADRSDVRRLGGSSARPRAGKDYAVH